MIPTDTGSSSSLSQTPLNSPTVFNFFFPDYRFPGVLASAGLTTPEFQLTSDTSAALQMNFLESGLLVNGSNTNGLTSFNKRNGAIVLDVGPWMTTAYAGDAVGTAALSCAIRDLRFMNAAVAQSNITDYKALVCIFLAGGNDSNNLVIPTIQSEYDNYAAIRTPVLAIPLSGSPYNILKLDNEGGVDYTPLNSDGHEYG